MLDRHGQPRSAINRRARAERDLSEMIGVCKGLIADGIVNHLEADTLTAWLDSRYEIVSHWPGSAISRRLRQIYADGRVSEDELDDLRDLLRRLSGGDAGLVCGEGASSELPLDRPPPTIEIPDRVFVLTGRFAFGPRAVCEGALRKVGGWCEANVTLQTDYVVVGTFASRDWKESSFGTKILKAVDYREKHGQPRIIGEDHWAAHV